MATAKKAPAKTAAKSAPKNEVAVRKSGGAVMSPADIKARLEAMTKAQEGKTAPVGGNRIRLTQDKQFALPDGSKTRDPLQLVVVDFLSRNEFYENAFDKNNPEPPGCFAIGDIPLRLVPSDNSPNKQAETCAECPMNVFGSRGDGKACKNGRMLAVMPVRGDGETDEDLANAPIWLMQVSPTALKAWDGYVKDVQRQYGVPPLGVITEVGFSEAVTYAQLTFSSVGPNEDVHVALDRVDEAKDLLNEEPDVSTYGQEKAKPAKAAAKTAARPAAKKMAGVRR